MNSWSGKNRNLLSMIASNGNENNQDIRYLRERASSLILHEPSSQNLSK